MYRGFDFLFPQARAVKLAEKVEVVFQRVLKRQRAPGRTALQSGKCQSFLHKSRRLLPIEQTTIDFSRYYIFPFLVFLLRIKLSSEKRYSNERMIIKSNFMHISREFILCKVVILKLKRLPNLISFFSSLIKRNLKEICGLFSNLQSN